MEQLRSLAGDAVNGRFMADGYNTNKKLVKDLVKKTTEGTYEALNKLGYKVDCDYIDGV